MRVMHQTQPRSDCPINYLVELLGDKWSLLILRDMLLNGKTSYGEFLTSKEKIATNILASRLTSLEQAGLITKARDSANHRKYIYSLTDKGLDLTPLFVEVMLWSGKYYPIPPERQHIMHKARTEKQRLIQAIRTGDQQEAYS